MKFFKRFLYFWFLFCGVGCPLFIAELYLLDLIDTSRVITPEKGPAFYGVAWLVTMTVVSLLAADRFHEDEE
jgi:quinol-cytochrome oxidoreductase complex cytochrome b subunit